jgi:ribonuclease P protein component
MSSGRRRGTTRIEIAWRPNDREHPRLGLIVPRYGHTAVARNRLRRRLRELARRRVLRALPPLDLVLRPRVAAYVATPDELAADLERWLHALSL